jgi:serine/threonine protein kinase
MTALVTAGHRGHPARIGPYEICGVLGVGGMGIVYDGVHSVTGQRVAVKTLHSIHHRTLHGLRTEVLALRRVSHPLVVAILEDGLLETPPWYSMERIEGRTLAEWHGQIWGNVAPHSQTVPLSLAGSVVEALTHSSEPSQTESQEGDQLPLAAAGRLEAVLTIFWRLCEPLWHVHAQGIIHRDLKPGNILLRIDDAPVIMDFGLASRSSSSADRGGLDVSIDGGGSAPYVAPEQIRGEFVDARADLYSFGCILYEALTGRPPYLGVTPREVVSKHLSEAPLPPSLLVRGVPSSIDRLVLHLLEKDPSRRLGHTDHLANALASAGRLPGRVFAPSDVSIEPYLYRPGLSGRTTVMKHVEDACRVAAKGTGSLHFVAGESGIGKTFLAVEASRLASTLDMQVIRGECQQLSTEVGGTEASAGPLLPFRRLLQLFADQCREAGHLGPPARLGGTARVLAAYEPSLASIFGMDPLPTQLALPPEANRRLVLAALLEILELIARDKPLFLILDDLQWADELSIALLESLLDGLVGKLRVVVLGLYRIEEASPQLTQLVQRMEIREIPLARLNEADIAQLVSDMLAMKSPPSSLVQFVHLRSEGNPFFAAEYLRLLANEGVLDRRDGAWTFTAPAPGEPIAGRLDAPTSIVDLIRRRLAYLGEKARRIARAAAILSREFENEVLAAVVELDEARLSVQLRELCRYQVLEAVAENRHRFVHDQLRTVISDEIPADERRRHHAACGRVLLSRTPVELHFSELAHHFRQSGETRMAIEYLEKAGHQALSRFSNAEAVKVFRELLDDASREPSLCNGPRCASWEKALGEALHGLGQLEPSRLHLQRAAALLGYEVADQPPSSHVELLRQLGRQVVHRLSRRDVAEADTERQGTLREVSRIYDRLLQIAYYQGRPLDMFTATLQTLNLAERGGPSPELGMAYAIAHAVAGILPIRGLAEIYLRKANETLAAHPDPCVDSYLQLLTGVYRSGTGEWLRARAAIDRGLELARILGFHRRRDELRLALSNWYFLRAQWQSAVNQFTADEVLGHRNDPQAHAWCYLMSAQVALVRAEGESAREALAHVRPRRGLLQRSELIWLWALEALEASRRGSRTAALEAIRAALKQVLAGPPVTFYCIEAYAVLAQVTLDLWQKTPPRAWIERAELDRLARSARDSLAAFARVFPTAVPRLLVCRGAYAWAHGRRALARRHWRRGVHEAQKLQLPHDELLLRWALAQSSSVCERESERKQILTRAQELGASALVARIEADLD